jgi:TonB family protein
LVLASDEDGGTLDALKFSLAGDIVELLVLTADEAFLLTLREAIGGERRLWHVLSADKVSDLLIAGEVGIVVFDVQALNEVAGLFISQIKRQFPDLVVVVAGVRDDENALAGLISAGTIYRFIHKPMSPGRAKLFAEAAVRKYGEQRRRVSRAPSRPAAANSGRRWLVGGTITILLLIAGVTWMLRQNASDDAVVAQVPEPAKSAESAVLARAAAELAEVHERLLARAENALLEERLDEAAAAIDTARKSGVESGRIAFLTAQLGKLRDQIKAAQVQTQAQTRAHNAPSAEPSKAIALLSLAAQRIDAGQLLEPDGDSARFYVQQALRTDPNNSDVLEAKRALASRLLTEARGAIDRRDFSHATAWIEGANGLAAPANIETTQSLLAMARNQVEVDAWTQLLKNANERLQQDRLIEPSNDNAKYYLLTLRNLNPSNAGLAPAMQDLGTRLVAKARRAFALQQYDAARSWLEEAAGVGFASPEAGSVQRDLDAALAKDALSNVLTPASQLTLQKSVQPVYPTRAEASKTEGWVELNFTVSEKGQVKDVSVYAVSIPGIFEAAAIKAVSQWRYQPVLRDSKPVAVHSRVRIRFALP